MDQLKAFVGFTPPTKNFFHMPNDWIDICANIDSLAELKIIQYIIRHTWGYQEYGVSKTISVDEFMHGRVRADGSRIDKGTGLKSDRSVKDGIKLAIQHGYIICDIDKSDLARIKKSYRLKMSLDECSPCEHSEGWILPPQENRQVETTPLTGRNYPSDRYFPPLCKVETTPRSEKDTVERHLEKDTVERKIAPPEKVPPANDPPTNQTPQQPFSINSFSPEEKRVLDLYCQLEIRPRINEKVKAQCAELAPHIQSLEDMKALHLFAKSALGDVANKRIFLGNLTGSLRAWLETRKPKEKKKSAEELQRESVEKLFRIQKQEEERQKAEEKRRQEEPRRNAFREALAKRGELGRLAV